MRNIDLKVIEELFSEKNLEKDIYVYGMGDYANILVRYLNTKWDYIKGVIITYSNEEYYCNKKVYKLNQICKALKNAIIIFAMSETTATAIIEDKKDIFMNNDVYIISEEMKEKMVIEVTNRETRSYYMKFLEKPFMFNYIETVNRCNGVCSFCPVNANEKQRPYKKMSEDLFKEIIHQLEEVRYTGNIALFSNNEPFIDERMLRFIEYAREHLSKANLYLFTNATLLTPEKYLSVMKYLDWMQIDLYFEDYEEEPDNIKIIRELSKENLLEEKTVFYRCAPSAVRESRGGSSPNSKVNYTTPYICRLPLQQIVVRPDGKISLCCNDALGEMTIGDLSKESLLDSWYGKDRRKIIEKSMNGRGNIGLCRFCNNMSIRSF